MITISFLKEVKDQIKHISWPDTKTVTRLTLTVLVVSFAAAVILGGFDAFFAKAFAEISKTKAPTNTESLIDNLQIDEATPSAETTSPESTPSSSPISN